MTIFLYNYLYFINFNNAYNSFSKKKYHRIKLILIFYTLVFNIIERKKNLIKFTNKLLFINIIKI